MHLKINKDVSSFWLNETSAKQLYTFVWQRTAYISCCGRLAWRCLSARGWWLPVFHLVWRRRVPPIPTRSSRWRHRWYKIHSLSNKWCLVVSSFVPPYNIIGVVFGYIYKRYWHHYTKASEVTNSPISASFSDSTFISLFSFSLVILAYICVLEIHLCPSTLLTDSIGMPLDRHTTVAIVWRAMCQVMCLWMQHFFMTVRSIILQEL